MPHVLRFAAVLALLLAVVGTTHAQDRQVPIDQDSTVYVVDADLRDRLSLFPEVTGFQEAVLFQKADEDYELVIQYRANSRTLRERRTLTADEVAALRERVTRRMRETNTVANLNQDGRYGLLASTTILGLAEGALLGEAIGLEGDGIGTMSLLAGASGFFIPLLATRNARATEGEADMVFYGGIQGYAHGAQLYGLINGDEGDTFSEEGAAALAAVLGAGESVLAHRIARTRNWSGGHAEMTSYTGLAGNLVGLGLAGSLSDDPSVRLASGLSLAGSVAGGLVGHTLGRSDRYTQGDARIYALTGYQLANLTSSLLIAGDADYDRLSAAFVTGAGVAGLAAGRLLVRDRDFTKTQGNIVLLGNFAGSLFGSGIAAGADADTETLAVLQALGSLAGAAITYGVFAGDARRQAARNSAGLNMNLNVTPSTASIPGPDGRRVRLSDSIVPKVTLTMQF